jgi:alkanesulfonate monooxygenase SsuD/methylene tetrahydromethanopterin reductase-like flavin-dependent oxidoreductase (luciferase family)
MRFQVLDIAFNPPHPVTGEQVPPADRLNRIVDTAVLAEELGFDSFAVGVRPLLDERGITARAGTADRPGDTSRDTTRDNETTTTEVAV